MSIGPITSTTARERGLRVDAEADPHAIDGLVDALLDRARARRRAAASPTPVRTAAPGRGRRSPAASTSASVPASVSAASTRSVPGSAWSTSRAARFTVGPKYVAGAGLDAGRSRSRPGPIPSTGCSATQVSSAAPDVEGVAGHRGGEHHLVADELHHDWPR